MKLGQYTVHGMRSSFRDYMGDETERAYRRGDAFLQRRALMSDWERYVLAMPKVKKARPRRAAHDETRLAA